MTFEEIQTRLEPFADDRRKTPLNRNRKPTGPWRDEAKVELLKRLWKDGLSASQIAARIGGVTRNAVIGKIHRLGLSGRSSGRSVREKVSAGVRRSYTTNPEHLRKLRETYLLIQAKKRALHAKQPPTLPAEPLLPFVEIDVPLYARRTVADIEPNQCRWPIGDPQAPDFHFCNGVQHGPFSYCEHHARLAYLPAQAFKGHYSHDGVKKRSGWRLRA